MKGRIREFLKDVAALAALFGIVWVFALFGWALQ